MTELGGTTPLNWNPADKLFSQLSFMLRTDYQPSDRFKTVRAALKLSGHRPTQGGAAGGLALPIRV